MRSCLQKYEQFQSTRHGKTSRENVQWEALTTSELGRTGSRCFQSLGWAKALGFAWKELGPSGDKPETQWSSRPKPTRETKGQALSPRLTSSVCTFQWPQPNGSKGILTIEVTLYNTGQEGEKMGLEKLTDNQHDCFAFNFLLLIIKNEN